MKIMGKRRFSCGFSLILRVRGLPKSVENVTRSSPECFGTPKNSVGATGLARLVAQMVLGQRNGGQNECSGGGELAPTREQLSGAGTTGRGRGGVVNLC